MFVREKLVAMPVLGRSRTMVVEPALRDNLLPTCVPAL